MANPTGEQFEITRGNARAVVTEIGAGLRVFEVGGVPYVEEFEADEKPPKGLGQVLLPWPNRTKGGEWEFQGEKQQLEITEEARGNAIHGLTRHKEWELLEHAESSITLAVDVEVQPGWPVPLRATITYDLHPRELTITHEIRNEGEQPIGVGVGTHPYFRIGDVPTDELTLTLPASRVRPYVADQQMPYADEQDVEGTEYDFRGGKVLAGVDLDTAFGSLATADDGTHHHVLTHQDKQLLVWTGPDFRWVQVFTPDDLTGRGRAVAIEPMTCPADALNTGTDLIELEPATSWSGSWGIRVL
ncbi:aldose 1-epimerase family protein [Amycolatopsis sp. FDAARGOS 1241]|uniref:aldose 1-epimerase family protein n=1 Tax=Amycolatopsis sp. FDAARGOS 1241 TaxID=2778070 RepID=UPI0019501F4E|nr:aldose 1-epimerase family protein [Amycolatopsis sp. FDAARGOS 1241]QRP46809.1 aldose 1-epimerase family protein [Amycolatopsis sp. FDAARGOS 1241]